VNQDRLVSFVQDLVRRPSLSGEESAVAKRVREEMVALGYDRVDVDEYGTVVGVIEGALPGKTLLFDAHTDTVGVTSGVPWQRDPFSAQLENDAVHGRGSADMKGALGAFVHAAADVERQTLHGRVVVSASTMEEVLEGVALHAVMDRESPDCVIIGEPTDLNLSRGGRGRAEIHLETIGRPSHSSAPQLGRNAVLDMVRAIQAVEEIELPEDSFMGPAVLALTDIISDPYPGHSVIPSICRVTYDRRLLPGETAEDVLAAITSLPVTATMQLKASIGFGEYRTYTGKMMRCEKFFPAWLLPDEHWLVQHAIGGLRSVGLDPDVRAYRFCTNAAYSAGIAGVPTVGFGPAAETDAHVIDERLLVEDLFAATRGYRAMIDAILGA
jgi:putative selenium metabolism hydrolase